MKKRDKLQLAKNVHHKYADSYRDKTKDIRPILVNNIPQGCEFPMDKLTREGKVVKQQIHLK